MSLYYVILFSLQSLPFRSKYYQRPVLSHFHAMNMVVIRKMAPCILTELHRRFGDTRQRGLPDDEGACLPETSVQVCQIARHYNRVDNKYDSAVRPADLTVRLFFPSE